MSRPGHISVQNLIKFTNGNILYNIFHWMFLGALYHFALLNHLHLKYHFWHMTKKSTILNILLEKINIYKL